MENISKQAIDNHRQRTSWWAFSKSIYRGSSESKLHGDLKQNVTLNHEAHNLLSEPID